MSAVPFVDLRVRDPREIETMRRVADRGVFVLGPEVRDFEAAFSRFIGTRSCVGLSSGTAAIELVLRAMGIGPGDEVLVPAYTAVATWMAVASVGATPVAVDSDPDTYSMDAGDAADKRSARTRAAIPVHLFGLPADLESMADALPGVPMIEDAAQAHGAFVGDNRAGSVGHAATFSFYPTKNLGALGDGGAVTTRDTELAEKLRLLRSYGWRERSVSLVIAGNARLDEMQAALLRVRLAHLDTNNAARRRHAQYYCDALDGVDAVWAPDAARWEPSVWHIFPIRHRDPVRLQSALRRRGVTCLQHYHPLPHETPALRNLRDRWDVPVAEELAARSLSLPMFPRLSTAAREQVVHEIRHAVAAV